MSPLDKRLDNLAARVIEASVMVHRELSPGLLESIYSRCLVCELEHHGIRSESEVYIPVYYRDIVIDCGYRADVIVEESIILELKAVEQVLPVHAAQLITYLKITGLDLGYLVNFNTEVLRRGVQRYLHPRHLKPHPHQLPSARALESL